jgi:hypothetical protein
MRSVWFENLVVDAMASEACCLLKANLSGELLSLIAMKCVRFLCRRSSTQPFCEQMIPLDSSSRAVRN